MSNAICSSNKNIPSDMLLGNVLFMTIRDMKITETDLFSLFRRNNIPTRFINPISPPNVFRRATASVKGNKLGIVIDDNKVILNVDEVLSDEDCIIRIISAHGIHEDKQDVEFEKLFSVKFFRDTGSIIYTDMYSDTAYSQTVSNIKNIINSRYNDWCVYHNKDTIRTLLMRIMASMHPVNLMPTGICKFIPDKNTEMLYDFKNLINDMSEYCDNSNESNAVEILPYIDTDEQRDLIQKNYKIELVDEMDELANNLKVVLDKGQLTSRQAQSYMSHFDDLLLKAEEYDALLGIYSEGIKKQLKQSLQLIKDNTDDDDEEYEEYDVE